MPAARAARLTAAGAPRYDTGMAEKLGIGAAFPSFPLTLVDGRTIALPDQLEGRYRAILFYRGHW